MSAFEEDQFEAAAEDALARTQYAARAMGTDVVEQDRQSTTRLVAELLVRIREERLVTCEHLSPSAPSIMWLPSWTDGRLLCGGCVEGANQALCRPVHCSLCRQLVENASVLVALAGPVMVLNALCEPCHDLDQAVAT